MGRKFCPKCGKETERFYESLCEQCFLSSFSLAEKLPKKILIKECKVCGKFLFENFFGSTENVVEGFLRKFLEKGINSISYRIFDCQIKLTLKKKIYDLEKIEEKTINLIKKRTICQSCAMKSSGYFQAILQVRAPQSLLQEIRDEIEKQIDYLNQYDKLAFISKFQELRNGFDVFIGSKKTANQIARNLKTKYKAKMKISKKFAGFIKGRKVYRDTILISFN